MHSSSKLHVSCHLKLHAMQGVFFHDNIQISLQWYHMGIVGLKLLGPDSVLRCHLTSMRNPIVEIRWSYDCLISTMGFPILVRRYLYIESGARVHPPYRHILSKLSCRVLSMWICMGPSTEIHYEFLVFGWSFGPLAKFHKGVVRFSRVRGMFH